jgi:hypothetical protein
MKFDPEIWGPHYWFFLHTVAESYPLNPNNVTKRKYYDLIQNIPLFIPNDDIGDKFSQMLDKYPIQPYLANRDSFVRWVHFIHNKINNNLGKKEMSLTDALDKYRKEYKPSLIKISENKIIKKHYIYAVLIIILLILIYIYWK